LNRIYTSTAKRAILTAQPTCELLKIKPIELDWCHETKAWKQLALPNEYDDDRTWPAHKNEIRPLIASPELLEMGEKWYLHEHFVNTACGEGIERIRREADTFFANLGYRHVPEKGIYIADPPTEDRVALFAHQGFGLAFLSCVLDIPYPTFCSHFDLGHSSMTVIEFKEFDGIAIPKVLQLSNDSHLYREGILTGYENRLRF
jgi:probable phosphoglycerate mutase